MTTGNDHLQSIQSRIDELEHTISKRGENIRTRTRQLKEDLKDELAPAELIRKHPIETAAATFVAGIALGRILKRMVTHPKTPATPPLIHTVAVESTAHPAVSRPVLGSIGFEMFHAGKDLAMTWLKHYLDEKSRTMR